MAAKHGRRTRQRPTSPGLSEGGGGRAGDTDIAPDVLRKALRHLPFATVAAAASSAGETLDQILDLCARVGARAVAMGIRADAPPAAAAGEGDAREQLQQLATRHGKARRRGSGPVEPTPAPRPADATDPVIDEYAREAFDLHERLASAVTLLGFAAGSPNPPPASVRRAVAARPPGCGGRSYRSAAQALAAIAFRLAPLTTRWDILSPSRLELPPHPVSDAGFAAEAAVVLREAASAGITRELVRSLCYAAALESELARPADRPASHLRGPGEIGDKFLAALRSAGRPLPAKDLIPRALRRPDNSKDRTHLAVLVEQGHLAVGRKRGQGYMLPEWERQGHFSQTERGRRRQ